MIFEAIMLICFGIAWPFSIWKSYKTKRTEGKSFAFLFIIFLGYISGTIYKLLYNLDVVVYLFMLNAIMVAIDIAFYIRNMQLGKNSKG